MEVKPRYRVKAKAVPIRVHVLDVVTRLNIPAERILQAAINNELQSCVVLGYGQGGDEYFASSIADGGDVLWLIERAKLALLTIELNDCPQMQENPAGEVVPFRRPEGRE